MARELVKLPRKCNRRDKSQEFSTSDDSLWIKIENGYVVPADGPADRQYVLFKYVFTDEERQKAQEVFE